MDFFFTIAGMVLFIEALMYYSTGRDSTDKPKTKWHKFGQGESGLRVWVDHKTGVHYIKAGMFDKSRVRINADGTPYTGE